jgi:hypothetical protein
LAFAAWTSLVAPDGSGRVNHLRDTAVGSPEIPSVEVIFGLIGGLDKPFAFHAADLKRETYFWPRREAVSSMPTWGTVEWSALPRAEAPDYGVVLTDQPGSRENRHRFDQHQHQRLKQKCKTAVGPGPGHPSAFWEYAGSSSAHSSFVTTTFTASVSGVSSTSLST